MAVSLVAAAAPPDLNVLKLLDGRYIGNPNVNLTIIDDEEDIYRGIRVCDNEVLISEIENAFNKDKAKANHSVFNQVGYNTSIILEFQNNGKEFTVGLSKNGKSVSLFISGERAAFK